MEEDLAFNYKAYSKVGAAGIWQFMRSTAKHFKLKVNYIVDERLDPIIAARAAAKLLKSNYVNQKQLKQKFKHIVLRRIKN